MLNTKFNRQLKLAICACAISFIQFIVGCSFIFSSILLAELNEPTSTIYINSEDASWIASVSVLVCPIGMLMIGVLADKIGRRKTLQVAYVPIIASWFIIANANTVRAIVIGRIVLGTTMGSVCCAYLYLSEVCPAESRPLYFSLATVFVSAGMLTECTMALFFSWKLIAFTLFVVSSVACVSLFLVPETPMWLRSHGRVSEAERTEKWFGQDAPAAATVAVPCDDGGDPAVPTAPAYWTLFARPAVWKPTLITLAFFVCQQGSGFYLLLFYSVDVLHDAKVQWDGITVTLMLSASRLLGSLVFLSLHNVPRKKMVVISSTGMAASLITIIAYMRYYKDVPEPPYTAVLIVAFVLYVFFALLAMLPLPWSLTTELFPMSVKGIMNGIVQICGYELLFAVIKMYPFLVSKYGMENVWSVFAAFCVASAFFGAYIMPETNGKTLNEIIATFEPPKESSKTNLP